MPNQATARSNPAPHPEFTDPSADVALIASDGTIFQVHSFVLCNSSEFFQGVLTLPQPPSTPRDAVKTIPMEENAPVVEALLRAITSKKVLPLETVELLKSFIRAADKYDMPSLLSAAHSMVRGNFFIRDPVGVYAIACRQGWRNEAVQASSQTLSLNITNPEVTRHFAGMDGQDVARLLNLHWRRRDAILDRLNRLSKDYTFACWNCGNTSYGDVWIRLRCRIVGEMFSDSSAGFIASRGYSLWPESAAMRNFACGCKEGFQRCSLFTAFEAIDDLLRRMLRKRPSVIEIG